MKHILFSFSGSLLICFSGYFIPKKQFSSTLQVKPVQEKPAEPDSSEIKIVFAGDIMGHEPQFKAALKEGNTYDYTDNFRFIKAYVQSADLAIANLEVTLAGPPYSGYPMFSSPDALAAASADAGFDVLQTSNNHTCDKGLKGVKRTLDVLDSLKIEHLGSYRTKAESDTNHPFIKTVNGIKLAILNYTYGTNGMPIPAGTVVNVIDTAIIRKDLSKAQTAGADFIIASYHWGLEYQRTESPEQRRIAEFSAKHGADFVMGGHPHVVQPIKKTAVSASDSIYTVYSLGNYVSNQRDRFKNGGIMVELNLVKTKEKTYLKSLAYVPVYVHRPSLPKVSYTLVPGYMDAGADTLLSMNAADKVLMQQFFKDTREHLKNIPETRFQ